MACCWVEKLAIVFVVLVAVVVNVVEDGERRGMQLVYCSGVWCCCTCSSTCNGRRGKM